METKYHNLSEEDIEKIVDKVCDKLEKKLYLNIGRGAVGVLWKAVILGAIALASYGAGIHFFK